MEIKPTGLKGFSRVYDDENNEIMGLAFIPPEEKVMTAKEMFEELGYEQIKHNVFDEPPKPNTFVTQDEPYILYKQENEKALEEIEFRFYGKNIWFKGYRKDLKHIIPCPINVKELKAINKQVEELGWNND